MGVAKLIASCKASLCLYLVLYIMYIVIAALNDMVVWLSYEHVNVAAEKLSPNTLSSIVFDARVSCMCSNGLGNRIATPQRSASAESVLD